MAVRKMRISVALPPEVAERVDRFAQGEGVSVSAAAAELVARGLDAGDAAGALERALARKAEQDAELAERVEAAVREMQVARKNIGKAARAGYASLAETTWLFQILMRWLDRVEGVEDKRVRAFSRKLDGQRIFKLFEAVGGALQRDKGTHLYRAMGTALKSPSFADITCEDVAGVDEARWDVLTGESNDSAAVRSLPGRKGAKK